VYHRVFRLFSNLSRVREFPFRIRLSVNELCSLHERLQTRGNVIENLASISLYITRVIPRMIRNRDSILARGTKVREIERSKG
jgi:hypothetical protein